MARRRDAVLAHRHPARQRDLLADLGRRQHAAMARLGALAELELDHLDLRIGGAGGELLGRESAVGIARAEGARAQLPDDAAAVLAMAGADAACPGCGTETA